MAVALTRYCFRVDNYHQMVEAGVIDEVDREIKMPLYARSDIPEAWLVDLGNDEIVIYREPSAEGYESVQTYGLGDEVSLSAFDLTLRVDDVLLRSS